MDEDSQGQCTTLCSRTIRAHLQSVRPAQLPPAFNCDVQDNGLGTPLLQRLSAAHPAAEVVLSQQFRMCGPLMDLSNRLTYGGQLRTGSAALESARLRLPHLGPVRACWVTLYILGVTMWLLRTSAEHVLSVYCRACWHSACSCCLACICTV